GYRRSSLLREANTPGDLCFCPLRRAYVCGVSKLLELGSFRLYHGQCCSSDSGYCRTSCASGMWSGAICLSFYPESVDVWTRCVLESGDLLGLDRLCEVCRRK